MNSNAIFELIEKIAATPGKNDKQALVLTGAQFGTFKRALSYAYDPFKIYGIAKRPDTIGDHVGHEFDAGTWELLDDLIARRLTGSNAIEAVRGEMTALSKESAELFWRIIKKDLRAGFSESTINKAVKGLIPEFPYQRCCLPKDANLEAFAWADGVISQEKADGMFANIDYSDSGSISIRSRQGSEFPIEPFAKMIAEMKVRLLPGYQHHGEILVRKAGEIMPRALGNGVMNSVLKGGHFAGDEEPIYLAWDAIPLSKVVPKGRYDVPYRQRLKNLITSLSKQYDGDAVALIPTRIVHSLKEAYAHAGELMKKGKEGTVISDPHAPWVDGTSKFKAKLKLEFSVDLKVVAITPGRKDTKNEGRAGALTCETSDGLLRVDVTVKNEALRDDIDANPDSWISKIIDVVANDITEPSESNDLHSLFLPRMAEAGYRLDKTTADSLERVLASKEMAILGAKLRDAA